MARTKQTARSSPGGLAPRNLLVTVDARDSMEIREAKESLNTAVRDNYGGKAIAERRGRLRELQTGSLFADSDDSEEDKPEYEEETEEEPEDDEEPEVARARAAYNEALKCKNGKMAWVCKVELDAAVENASKSLHNSDVVVEVRGTKRALEAEPEAEPEAELTCPKAKRRATMARKKEQCNAEAKVLLEVLHSHFRSDGTVCTGARSAANPFPLFEEFSGTGLNRVAAVWTQMAVETRKMAKMALSKEKGTKARARHAKLEAAARRANAAVAKLEMMFD